MRGMTDGPQQPGSPPPGGYGYPHSGYGYPHAADSQQPAGPAWTPPSSGLGHGAQSPQHQGEPDWSALAERTEAGQRRRRLLMIGGGVLGAVAIAGIVATAVITTSHRNQAATQPTQSQTALPVQPTPSFSAVTPPPAPDPLAVISDARRDTAPLTAAGMFPGTQLNMAGRLYAKGALDATGTCSSAAAGGLGTVLADNGCRKVLRVTYRRNGIAVTVGVAVFDTKAAAKRAWEQYQGYVLPLAGDGVPAFCHATACQTSANSIGRYAYFTTAGLTSGAAVTAGDPQVKQAAGDISAFAFNRIVQRGRDQAATSG